MTLIRSSEIDSHLVSYAFLKTDSQYERDYYDYFVPFIKEVLIKYEEIVVTANNIQDNLKKEFKIDLPIKVIDTIIRRFNRQGILYSESNVLKINKGKIENNNFSLRKQQILTQHSMLIESVIKYAADNYQEKFDYKMAEKSINELINQNALTFLKDIEMNNDASLVLYREDSQNALITANFIGYIYNYNEPMYNHLLEIVKGHMLLKAIYMVDGEDLERLKMKFNKTQIYFDTTFILYALGHSGPELQKPCLELMELLSNSNAILRCFSHNVDEARGILEYCKNNINNPNVDRYGTIAMFIENKLDDFDIDDIIYNLETSISKELKIDIVTHIPYNDHKNVINEVELTGYLDGKIKYKSKRALEKDVSSISATMRLRKGNRTVYFEECKALFVTTNYNLAKSSREYFSDRDEPKVVTPVIHDSLLMNLVWLKNPQLTPNLPSSILMADCYAAGQPSKKLWATYYSILETLRDSGQISEEKVLMLKYSQGIKTFVMDETLGNDELMTVGSVNVILRKLEDQQKNEKQLAIELEREQQEIFKSQLQKQINNISIELEATNAALEEQATTLETLREEPNQLINKIARTKAKNLKIIIVLIAALFIGVTVVIGTTTMSAFSLTWQRITVLITTVVPLLFGLLGLTLKRPINMLENKLFLINRQRLIKKIKK